MFVPDKLFKPILTNALAYYKNLYITDAKSLITLGPGWKGWPGTRAYLAASSAAAEKNGQCFWHQMMSGFGFPANEASNLAFRPSRIRTSLNSWVILAECCCSVIKSKFWSNILKSMEPLCRKDTICRSSKCLQTT